MPPTTSTGHRLKALVGTSVHRCAKLLLQGEHLARTGGRLPVTLIIPLTPSSISHCSLHKLHLGAIQSSDGRDVWIAQKWLARLASNRIKNSSKDNGSSTTDVSLGHQGSGPRSDRRS